MALQSKLPTRQHQMRTHSHIAGFLKAWFIEIVYQWISLSDVPGKPYQYSSDRSKMINRVITSTAR